MKTLRAGFRPGIGLAMAPLALALLCAQAQPPAIPDAPQPHLDLPTGGVAPGSGSSSSSSGGAADTSAPVAPAPQTAAPPTPAAPGTDQAGPVVGAAAGQPPAGGHCAPGDPSCLVLHVDEVNVAFTVKDTKGKLVADIKPNEVQVFENGRPMRVVRFIDEGDVQPLAVAIVIDQSMVQQQMDTVNAALDALPGAFSRYDEVSVFTYNKSAKQVTEFTGAQSPRAAQAIETSKASGRDALLAGSLGGPMAQTLVLNDQQFDPNTEPVHGHSGLALNAPREVHPLYDAILAAATALSTQPIERRRVVYVISNGNESGSKTTGKELLKYLQVNDIHVSGTLVGIQTSLPVVGMLDRIHLPLQMRDNVLSPLANETGGNVDAEFRATAIERGFAKVVGEARNRYVITYDSPEAFVDGKYRSWNVTILRPGLTVIAQPGYYPQSQELRQRRPETPATLGNGPGWQQGRPQ